MKTERLLTPSKITAWLDCDHFLTLRNQVDDGQLAVSGQPFGSFAQLLVDKGIQHEADCLAEYRRQGLSIFEVPGRDPGESFTAWVKRIGNPLERGDDVIYQMPLVHNGIRGIADFLVRSNGAVGGRPVYEPLDAKLARTEAKPGHVLQLCFYADALEALTGSCPEFVHLWLGSGQIESLRTAGVRPYWNRLRGQLTGLLSEPSVEVATVPERCTHCQFCEFADVCEKEWRDADSLTYVAGIRNDDQDKLESSGITSLGQLAVCTSEVELVRPERLQRLITQASLQVESREVPELAPPFRIVAANDDPTWGRGFELLPEPNDGDLFLDFEGDPFWRAEVGLFFLFGFIAKTTEGNWEYQAIWAHDRDQEGVGVQSLIEIFEARRQQFPDMHVYHYNHTERSVMQSLAAQHGVGEVALSQMVNEGLFVDLLLVLRNAIQVGTESYGLKYLERITSYKRGHEIDQGAGAVVEYEDYMVHGTEESLERIAAYNEDDVRATLALRDWLVTHRPAGTEWRSNILEMEEAHPELDEQIAALHSFGDGTPEQLLGDLLGYWVSEWIATSTPQLLKLSQDTDSILDDPEVIAGLVPLGIEERIGKSGKPVVPGARFRFPAQTLADDFLDGSDPSVMYLADEGRTGFTSVLAVDRIHSELLFIWNERASELGTMPNAVVLNDWVSPKPKPEALGMLAAAVLAPTGGMEPNPVSMALLRQDVPRFLEGAGPKSGRFSDDVADIVQWAPNLDHSYVAIQGPPGTGKTFRGAQIVHSLIAAGKRVGISAMSHHAIDNLLEEIVKTFEEKGDIALLKAVRRGFEPSGGGLAGVRYAASNTPCAKSEYNLVAGTTWLFAGRDLRSAPVDFLIVDEAGQLALADAVAASLSAHNVILLGDPLQLSQVSQALHPRVSGRSVLEHALGDEITISLDRGVFLAETWRMHPDVCRFISERIYEGRLTSYRTCANQSTVSGTGLRWLQAEHSGRATESAEEAELVANEIARLVGSGWTDQHLKKSDLTVEDFMVVVPYNDQVRLMRDRLDSSSVTNGVRVGTVDKFQGREAPIVFFAMTSSSSEDMPRGADFLFSRNRLNVAISRARCLAYLVCTEEILNTRARTIEEMRLISTLCALVEYAQS